MAPKEIILRNAKSYINSMPKKKLYAYLFLFVVIMGTCFVGLSFIQKESYVALFSGLSLEDASAVVSKLKESKIPYKLEMNGTTICVPKKKVYDVRLLLASQNALPGGGGGVGFELFDKTSYGMTEFLQNIHYKRAIQGELQRTINQMPEVKASRVHIAIPEKTLFREKEKEVTASIFLKLRHGRMISQEQIMSIVYLVSGSIEGMKPENVVVVDASGKVLFKQDASSSNYAITAHQLELQRIVEKKIEESIQSMLDRIIPANKSIVRANVELNFRRIEKTEAHYLPEKSAITAEKRSKEKVVSKNEEGKGVPGVASNIKTEKKDTMNKVNESERQEDQISYEVSKTIKNITEPIGDIKRISLAVLIDGKYEKAKSGKDEKLNYIPRSEQELQNIKNLVARAAGFDNERGDNIEVLNMPFEIEAATEEKINGTEQKELYFDIARYGFYLLMLVSFFFFAIRPLMNILKIKRKDAYEVKDMYIKESGDGMKPLEAKRGILPEALTDKELVSTIIKSWVKEGTGG